MSIETPAEADARAAEVEDDLVAFFRALRPDERRAYDAIADRDRSGHSSARKSDS